ncbi:hypothetical protein Cni_G22057 [Canna indica]|uniref:Uncharacterized protein n=1 Tax=Canna indica TaxID=4628 RepID=A0AAQ3QKV6_9LILI|nr:hypothetical protein Cni_G22057 [Canna indica]
MITGGIGLQSRCLVQLAHHGPSPSLVFSIRPERPLISLVGVSFIGSGHVLVLANPNQTTQACFTEEYRPFNVANLGPLTTVGFSSNVAVLELCGSSAVTGHSLVDRHASPAPLRRSPRLLGRADCGGSSLDRVMKRKELLLSPLSSDVTMVGHFLKSSAPNPSSKADTHLSSLDNKEKMVRLGKLDIKDVDDPARELLRNKQGSVGSF